MSREQPLNDIFLRLTQLGIHVVSMRNKVNRLEEIFMRLVEGQGAGRGSRRLMDAQVKTDLPQPVNLAQVNWCGFKTIIIREYGRIIRIWGQTLVPPAVQTTLYFTIFGSVIGRRVGQMGGFDYMQFIAPGLIMMQRDPELLRQRGRLVLRREVRQAHRGAAGIAAAKLADRRRLRGRGPAARPAGRQRGDGGGAAVRETAGAAPRSSSSALFSSPRSCFRWPASSMRCSPRTSTR